MNQDKFIISRIEDKLEQCQRDTFITTTGFLNMHEQSQALNLTKRTGDAKAFFYGGYEDAERRILMFVPEAFADTLAEALLIEQPLSVLHIKVAPGGKKLSHRDYLGAVLGLGLDRSVIGDILVHEHGADMVVRNEILDFLLAEFHSAGRSNLEINIGSVDALTVPEKRIRTVKDTLSSNRLDSVVATAFRVSRSDAAKAIKSGLVFINHEEVTKIDKKVDEGAVIVFRGKGKAVLKELSGVSKKGRIWAEFNIFI